MFDRSRVLQNGYLVAASYLFYAQWDWRFLSLIAISSAVDFCVGLGFSKTDHRFRRRLLLAASIAVNLGFLGFFKYFNFFVENFSHAFTLLGEPVADPALLRSVLPVGISFYTFQTLSYSTDVGWRKKLRKRRSSSPRKIDEVRVHRRGEDVLSDANSLLRAESLAQRILRLAKPKSIAT